MKSLEEQQPTLESAEQPVVISVNTLTVAKPAYKRGRHHDEMSSPTIQLVAGLCQNFL